VTSFHAAGRIDPPGLQERLELVAEIPLRQESIRARSVRLVAGRGARVEGDDDDERSVRTRLERARDAETVEPGKHGLDDHEIGGKLRCRLQGRRSAARGADDAQVAARCDQVKRAGEERLAFVGHEHAERPY
jgi:hypothetical protein